jgi:hemolysin D
MTGTKITRRQAAARAAAPPAPPELATALEVADQPGHHPGDFAFLPLALAMVREPPSRAAMVVAATISVLVVGGIILSCFTYTTIYAQAPGMVLATAGTKVIESREQGVVASINVRDGQRVAAGDILVTLDSTNALARQALVAGKMADTRGSELRLRAEMNAVVAGVLDPPPAIRWTDDIPEPVRLRESAVMRADLARLSATYAELDSRRRAKEAARDGFAASIVKQRSLLATTAEHLQMHVDLAGTGTESQAQVLVNTLILRRQQVDLVALQTALADATAAIVRIEAERVDARAKLVEADQQALADAERQADELVQQLVRADKLVTDMTLRAPVAGTVTATAVTTVGQVAMAGQQLMQIVPDNAALQIQAYVLNTDIGFVHTGQRAVIKVDTFPYTRYGVLHGTVGQVSDAAIPGQQALLQQKNQSTAVRGGNLSDTAAAEQTGDLVFPITVTTDKTSILVGGRDSPLLPGMSVVVDVETMRQRLIAWLLYPLARGIAH